MHVQGTHRGSKSLAAARGTALGQAWLRFPRRSLGHGVGLGNVHGDCGEAKRVAVQGSGKRTSQRQVEKSLSTTASRVRASHLRVLKKTKKTSSSEDKLENQSESKQPRPKALAESTRQLRANRQQQTTGQQQTTTTTDY